MQKARTATTWNGGAMAGYLSTPLRSLRRREYGGATSAQTLGTSRKTTSNTSRVGATGMTRTGATSFGTSHHTAGHTGTHPGGQHSSSRNDMGVAP